MLAAAYQGEGRKSMTAPNKLDLDKIAAQAKVNPVIVWQMLFGNRQDVRAEDIARIQGALDRLGLATDEPQVKGRAGFILVVMPNAQSFGTFGGPVMQAFANLAKQQNYLLTNFIPASSPETDLVSLFRAFNYAIMITTRDTPRLAEACEAAGRPYVLAEADYQDTGQLGVAIGLDNGQAARVAMAHLLDLGHRRIGFISGVPGHPSSEARQAEYLAALQEAGIQPERKWIFAGAWEEDSGYAGGKALLSLDERPTAIFCANDTMALGAMRAAHEAELEIGYDVSIMGFDDIGAASHVSPPLTTIRQHLDQMGQVAFECIQQFAAGQQPQRRILLPAELIVRESTGAPPRG
jgi:LacI family transcriptional regulator